ncbi:NAD(P)H-binding protein [Saliphagus sp. LR7]|uniref:NAD(P)H-binding protein n=1 Tax=Saliphagus sp. LR7 TaxID=2282654 RepID=UPI000DF76974|nr:NAD(P)H-binding protein [Saliphagus sp. LR7]
MRVLVTGATGFIGSRLIPTLRARGHDVVVLTRDADGYDGPADTVYEGNVLEAGTFEHTLSDIDAAYYFIHSMGAGDDFAEKDRQGAANFERAASDAKVDHVIYLSGLGDEDDDLSKHLQSRRNVERILEAGNFEVTVLRAAIIIGAGNDSFEIVRQLATRLPVMATPRWVRNDCQPIAVDDVITYLIGVLELPDIAGDTFEIGGPAVLTYRSLLKRTAAIVGRPAYIIPVPVLTPRLSAYWVNLVTDVPSDLIQPLVKGLENEVTANDTTIRRYLPIELTPIDEAINRAIDGEEEMSALVARVVAKLDDTAVELE